MRRVLFLVAILGAITEVRAARYLEGDEIEQVIKQIQIAAQQSNYQGSFVYQQSNQIRTSKITHVFDGGIEFEKLEILDGQAREYIRKNDEVYCYIPQTNTIQIEKSSGQEMFPSVLNGSSTQISKNYQISKTDQTRVAGGVCQNYEFEARDKMRYSYRLCAEKNTGLVLRIQTLSKLKDVLEQIAFTQISFNSADRNKIKTSFQNTTNWRIENLSDKSNIKTGWQVNQLPDGYRKILETRRQLGNAGDSNGDKARHTVQMMYSDGLSNFSVFIEPDVTGRAEGVLQQGALSIVGKRHSDYWLTVVGEIPISAAKQVINSIELKNK